VSITRVLAQATVTNLEPAETWYTLLFDRPPDARPMDGLIEWHLGDSFGVQVRVEAHRAGQSAMVLSESDLDRLIARLDASGVSHDPPQDVTASRILVLTDPDGNRIVVSGEFAGS
jgi:predicted enzyme related to lactoylglutathione lyase